MDEFVIKDPVFIGRKLVSKVEAPPEFKKYIKNDTLFIEYDAEIHADESILNIPLTATILPLAWLTGSNIHVNVLDRTFKESMEKLRQTFKKIYPKGKFTTEITTSETVENKIDPKHPNESTGLLFSGGVDSTYTLISNLDKKPKLVMLWGVDDFPYPERRDHWQKITSIYAEYAKKKKLDLYIAKTNVSQILDNHRIDHNFHKEIYNGKIRPAIQHSLILLPIAAPLSINRFNHLLIAASGTPIFDYTKRPRAARAITDEKITWADLNVENHGFISRLDKTQTIAEYSKTDNLVLRVCLRSQIIDGEINDSACEKCLRTIASLALFGADPNDVGFRVDDSTFENMRDMWESRKTSLFGTTWREMKDRAAENTDHDIYGSREFFEWFKHFDFKSTEKNWFYTDLYTSLPYNLAVILDKIYGKLGINVHEDPYIRDP